MSILTLNKFLLNGWRESEAVIPEAISGHYLDVASRALAAIRRSVLVGETFTDLFEEMDSIRKDLHVENGSEAVSACATRVEDLLVTYQNRLRSADQDRAAEEGDRRFRHIRLSGRFGAGEPKLDARAASISCFSGQRHVVSGAPVWREPRAPRRCRIGDASAGR